MFYRTLYDLYFIIINIFLKLILEIGRNTLEILCYISILLNFEICCKHAAFSRQFYNPDPNSKTVKYVIDI